MLTIEQYFMGRDKAYPEECTDEIRANAADTVSKANELISRYVVDGGSTSPCLRSGWRPLDVNNRVPGAAIRSKHITAQAIDLSDPSHKLKEWCLNNLEVLEELGLWMEAPECTPTWLHIQTVSPKSGHRVFIA